MFVEEKELTVVCIRLCGLTHTLHTHHVHQPRQVSQERASVQPVVVARGCGMDLCRFQVAVLVAFSVILLFIPLPYRIFLFLFFLLLFLLAFLLLQGPEERKSTRGGFGGRVWISSGFGPDLGTPDIPRWLHIQFFTRNPNLRSKT